MAPHPHYTPALRRVNHLLRSSPVRPPAFFDGPAPTAYNDSVIKAM